MASASSDSYAILDLFVQLDYSPLWRKPMKEVKARAALPDIKHRRGLKEAHQTFDAIRARLDAIYASAENGRNLKKMVSVVVLISQMCVDTLLSSKFVAAGLMTKIIPLLGQDTPTRHVALQALFIVARHGGPSVTQELATSIRLLTTLVQEYFDDDDTVRVAISIVVPIFRCLFAGASPFTPPLAHQTSLSAVLQITITELRPPLAPGRCILPDALQLLVAPTETCPNECRANPSLMPILAAVTRSKSFGARAAALNGLINLHQPPPCNEPPIVSLLRLTEALFDDIPPHILAGLLPTHPESSYSFSLFLDLSEYTRLVATLSEPTRDLYAFGKELAELTQRHDFVVSKLIDDRDVVPESVYFPEWLETFMASAQELRRRATSESDRDLANVLEMKVLLLRGDWAKARELSQQVVVRNPGLAYAYYVMTRGASRPAALHAAKEGIRCITASPFTRSQLLWIAVEMAARAGFVLQGASVDLHPRVQLLASSALADAQTFLAEVPRDHPSTGNVLNWVILLTLLLQKPGHMEEFQFALQRAQQSSGLLAHFGYSSMDLDLQDTREYVCEEYGRASQEWDHLVTGLDRIPSKVVHLPPDRDEYLWLDQAGFDQPKTSAKLGSDQLYRCSWCRMPSAQLRRCTGCRAALYCDLRCQKSHWRTHRESCGAGKK